MPKQHYELLCLFQADLDDSALRGILDRLKAEIANAGGEIQTEDIWGKRRLGYEIKKQHEGIYVLYTLLGNGNIDSHIVSFERTEPNMLRHLTTASTKAKFLEDERRTKAEEEERVRREADEKRRSEEDARRKAAEEERKAREAEAQQKQAEEKEAERLAESTAGVSNEIPEEKEIEQGLSEDNDGQDEEDEAGKQE